MTFLKKNLFRSLVVFTLIIASDDNSFATHATASPVIVGSSGKTDIYVAGYSNNDQYNYIPTYWKNGKPVYLTEGKRQGKATGIAVAGNDVYVSGEAHYGRQSSAVYWKNGIAVILTDGNNRASATGIAVVGNDVYVSGHEASKNGLLVAMYWKNGIPIHMTDENHYEPTTAIAVSGNDVYVAGFDQDMHNLEFSIAKYWKNGKRFHLPQAIKKQPQVV